MLRFAEKRRVMKKQEDSNRVLGEPETVYATSGQLSADNITRSKTHNKSSKSDIQKEWEECLRIYRSGDAASRSALIPRMEQWIRNHSTQERIQSGLQQSLATVGERKVYTEEEADKELRRVFSWLK